MKTFLILFLFSFSSIAQINPSGNESHVMRAEGQLVSVRLVVGEPIRIFVVGREEAKLNLSDMTLTVKRLNPYPGKILKIDQNNNYFSISDPVDLKKNNDIEVTTKIMNKSETFRFKVKGQMP